MKRWKVNRDGLGKGFQESWIVINEEQTKHYEPLDRYASHFLQRCILYIHMGRTQVLFSWHYEAFCRTETHSGAAYSISSTPPFP